MKATFLAFITTNKGKGISFQWMKIQNLFIIFLNKKEMKK